MTDPAGDRVPRESKACSRLPCDLPPQQAHHASFRRQVGTHNENGVMDRELRNDGGDVLDRVARGASTLRPSVTVIANYLPNSRSLHSLAE